MGMLAGILTRKFNKEKEYELRLVLFNIITICGIVGGIIAFVASIIIKLPLIQDIATIIALLLLAVCLYLGNYKNMLEQSSFAIIFVITIFLFPVMFFTAGGAYSGMGYWYAIGIIFDFLLIEGIACYIMLGLQLIVIFGSYAVAFFYPHFVTELSRASVFADMLHSLMVLALSTGLIVRLQNKVYRQKITKIEKMNEELKRLSSEAEAANRAKSDFLARMSHEIRTPINAVMGMDEMILRESNDIGIRQYAINIQDASNVLLSLVNDILDFSKIESGKMELVENPYFIGSVLNDVINITSIRAEQKGLEFKLDISKDIYNEFMGDEKKLRQILVNILGNAIKYTQNGSVTLSASMRENTGTDFVILVIKVTDTGIGIHSEEKDKLFDKFGRLDLDHTGNIEGTGLGLAITKHLVDLMGGGIDVESIYGQGSAFTIELPQKYLSKECLGDFGEQHKEYIKNKNAYHERFHAPEVNILAVDDNAMNRNIVGMLLKKTQINVDTCASGKECLEMTRRKFYDIILLDYMMPEMNGVDTLHQAKGIPGYICKESVFIVVTADAVMGAKEKYLKEGFDDYISKPINPGALEKLVLKHIPKEKVIKVDKKTLVTEGMPVYEPGMETGVNIDYKLALDYCGGDESFLNEMYGLYIESDKRDAIEKAYKEEDWNNYRILVHSLKSNSLSIGAAELSDAALKLEMAAKANDIETIKTCHAGTMELYEALLCWCRKQQG